jgi:drug/metabolite transporter (DMT)-like permease
MDGMQSRPPMTRGRGEHFAAAMLLLGTVFWGCGFTWAKAAISGINGAIHLRPGAGFGAVFSLIVRFTVAAIIWPIIFPRSRRGWTLKSVWRCLWIGSLLAASLIVQHVGLERTSESVSAFLTSLTVLFVPIFLTIVERRPPRGVLWIGVILATAGVWLMTGAQPGGFGFGELLGLACAAGFSVYILAVNAAAQAEDAFRLTFGQFVVVAVACLVTGAVMPGGTILQHPAAMARLLILPQIGWNLLLLSLLTTTAAFGLLTHFQPRLEPTRATLIYLMEPVIAAVYAAVAAGHAIGPSAVGGAALILIANLLVEVLSGRKSVEPSPPTKIVPSPSTPGEG